MSSFQLWRVFLFLFSLFFYWPSNIFDECIFMIRACVRNVAVKKGKKWKRPSNSDSMIRILESLVWLAAYLGFEEISRGFALI